MSTRAAKIFLFFGILTGMITACLGLETRHSNHLGWALLFAGAGFITVGSLSLGILSLRTGQVTWRADRSLWLPCISLLAISLITPLEYLYLPSVLPRGDFAQDAGLIVFAGGLAFYLLALQSKNPWDFKRTASIEKTFPILSTILCPISASLLLFGLGLGIGFGSWTGLMLSFTLLFPGLLHRQAAVQKHRYPLKK